MRIVFVLLLINLISCNSVEKSEMKSNFGLQTDGSEIIQQLVINEYSSKGTLVNNQGEESDWIELYNPTDSALIINNNEWFLSDDEKKTDKFALPEMTIAPHGFVLILCDGEASSEEYIHANFKISSHNETISLYQNAELKDEIICTEELKKKFSFGRESDGEALWNTMKVPSPGKSNNSSENYAETAH